MTYNVDFGWNSKIFHTFLKVYCKLSGFGILQHFFHKFWLDLECLNCWFWLEFQKLPHLFYIVFFENCLDLEWPNTLILVGIPKSSTGGVWISNGIAHYMRCDQAKGVWSRSNSIFIFLIDCILHLQSYLLLQTPLKLVHWFQRYGQLKGCKNNRKQRNYLLCLAIS